jgi:hypothetical protein
MKAEIYYFACIASQYEDSIGYKHNQEIPVSDIWKVAEEIYNKGLNVKITHSSHNGEKKIMLYVDDKHFNQR